MKKALLVTTVSGFVPQFEMNNVKILQQMGYEVHYAANYNIPSYGMDNCRLDGTGIIRHQIDFVRSPYSLKNRAVYRQLKQLMQTEQFQLVHCHTPMGGVMARLAAQATRTGPVAYTAHGFHFYKGAPLINWLCYYPMERWLSHYVQQQICINKEDYLCAKKFYARHVDYIPGVGVDIGKILGTANINVAKKREDLGISPDKKVILSAGELITRKNHESAIRAIAEASDVSIVYVICGHGELENYLKNLVRKLKIEQQVFFAGYRTDLLEIYRIADLYLFPSFQEGLPMALLEAMASGLPVICSDIRGSRDLMGKYISKGSANSWDMYAGGAMVKRANDVAAYAEAINQLLYSLEHLEKYGRRNAKAVEQFTIEKVSARMKKIYCKMEEEC